MNEKIEGSLSQGPKRDKELLKENKNSQPEKGLS